MIVVFGKLFGLALKAAWGISRILFTLLFLPFTIIGAFLYGFVQLAFVLLIAAAIMACIGSVFRVLV